MKIGKRSKRKKQNEDSDSCVDSDDDNGSSEEKGNVWYVKWILLYSITISDVCKTRLWLY